MRTTLDLPDSLFREAKIHAATKGITLKELFTKGLEMALHPVIVVSPETHPTPKEEHKN